MLFNSIDFAIFLPVVFAIYWLVQRGPLRVQNAILVVASYLFYGWWDYRFLSLILFSTIVDFLVGLRLERTEHTGTRKALLWTSIGVNLGMLGFFKYFNFFVENFTEAFRLFGVPFEGPALNIILPVGISFYTFQTLSYTIDVYRGKLKPTGDFVAFAAFVSFFPQLVAGPIERATNLLPQFYQKRAFDYGKAVDGMRQILWGLFKKVVIADNCAEFANEIFANSGELSSSTLIMGALFFTFQIYGDFSGYSDIAIGVSRLFGFDLMKNFAFPYFSRDIAEFWRRWHISLSTWFRDYLYIPLGGSRGGSLMKVRNTFVIFIVSGFWHGANWTFIVWGLLNALYFLPLLLTKQNRMNLDIVAYDRLFPNLRELVSILTTFILTVIAWIFFRAENLGHAIDYLIGIADSSILSLPQLSNMPKAFTVCILLMVFIAIEWFGRTGAFAIAHVDRLLNKPLRWTFYALIIFMIGMYMQTTETPFIYFQF